MREGPVLLPCPFCGGEAKVMLDPDPGCSKPWWMVGCLNSRGDDDCPGFRSDYTTQEAAIALWNTRTSAPVAAEERPEAIVLRSIDRALVNVNDFFLGGSDAEWIENDQVDEITMLVDLVREFGRDGIYALVAAKRGHRTGHWRHDDTPEYQAALEKADQLLALASRGGDK